MQPFQERKPARSSRGHAMVALMIVIGMFIVFPLGLLGFEFLRYIVFQQQLKADCESSVLAGAATLASAKCTANDPEAIKNAQTQAVVAALEFFRRNSMANLSLKDAQSITDDPNTAQNPQIGQAILSFLFVNAKREAVPMGTPAANVRLRAYYGYRPLFAPAIGIKQVTMYAEATAGIAPLDVVLCFDVSGSMDDQTPVTLVKRFWDGSKVNYYIANRGRRNPGNGLLYNLLLPPDTGTKANAIGPQNLTAASYFGNDSNATPYFFTESNPTDFPDNVMRGLRANIKTDSGTADSEVGRPPGNFDPKNPSDINGNGVYPNDDVTGFTDLVVNLDGKPVFGGFTEGDFTFPNVATLVEAARGNLDLPSGEFQNSQCGNPSSDLPPPRKGYRDAYLKAAARVISPMKQAQDAAADFLATMRATADASIGLVAFADAIGTDSKSTWAPEDTKNAESIVDPSWLAGGKNAAPMPLIHLGETVPPAPSNYESVIAYLNMLRATGKTDIADALKQAREDLTTRQRDDARPTIVLFTDGLPNIPGDGKGGASSSAAQAAYDEAERCRKAGITVYTIGLALNPTLQPIQNEVLGDLSTYPPLPKGHGIAKITGGTYVSVTNISDLKRAFQAVQRGLVVLR
jgi:hypothetical protein